MADIKDVQIEESWKMTLADEFQQPYFQNIKDTLVKEKEAGKVVYPPDNLIFNAFNTIPFNEVKVVVLGQDPYHGPGEAHGHSFSVPKGIKIPPSLRNIYKELANDIDGFVIPKHGCLEEWANQGVFLLNAFLTVVHKTPKSHEKIGWDKFTDAVIKKLSDEREGIVFMLWGGFAKKKAELIDPTKHLILEAAHPSPLAGNAFQGSKHFSQANAYLAKQGLAAINWKLSE
jgi:uracil-DNA glycosylase